MLRMPAAAMTCASPSFAQVMPMAPAANSMWTISTVLFALACGRQATPWLRQVCAMRAILASIWSRSTRRAGVSSSLFRRFSRGVAAIHLLGQARGPVSVLDKSQGLQIVQGFGFEPLAALQAIDKVSYGCIETHLI